jgi:hypothetical protein
MALPPTSPLPGQGLLEARNIRADLADLLELIYPASHERNLDLITLEDIRARYRLTELGAPAMNAIAQARRIIRHSGGYHEIGLCEFHIGLIYLHWGDARGAAQQFAEARQQWSFVNRMDGACLATFAQGRVRHYALEYEAGMNLYHQAQREMGRLRWRTPSANLDQFRERLQALLDAAQEALREAMRPPDIDSQPQPGRPPAPDEADEAPPQGARTAAPRPGVPTIAEPATEYRFNCPLPGHTKPSDRYVWYQVIERLEKNFLPEIHKYTWLLVDTSRRKGDNEEQRLIVVVGGARTGSIILRPFTGDDGIGQRIYLAELDELEDVDFTRDAYNGKVTLSSSIHQIPVRADQILGVVVGKWVNYPAMEER